MSQIAKNCTTLRVLLDLCGAVKLENVCLPKKEIWTWTLIKGKTTFHHKYFLEYFFLLRGNKIVGQVDKASQGALKKWGDGAAGQIMLLATSLVGKSSILKIVCIAWRSCPTWHDIPECLSNNRCKAYQHCRTMTKLMHATISRTHRLPESPECHFAVNLLGSGKVHIDHMWKWFSENPTYVDLHVRHFWCCDSTHARDGISCGKRQIWGPCGCSSPFLVQIGHCTHDILILSLPAKVWRTHAQRKRCFHFAVSKLRHPLASPRKL